MSQAQRASELIEIYGNFPVANQFASNDMSPDLLESELPAFSAAFDPDPLMKRHAACDECRKRKLKCSGDPAGCARCLKQDLTCHYSVQKQMGRPRKRQKTDHDGHTTNNDPSNSNPPPPLPEPAIDPELMARMNERSEFENICTGPVAQTIKRSSNRIDHNVSHTTQLPRSTSQNSGSGSARTSPYDQPQTPPDGVPIPSINYLNDSSLWPDFSGMSTLPMPVQDSHRKDYPMRFDPSNQSDSSNPFESHSDPSALLDMPSVPECPCLPNSYLTLSTLSTLSAFPVSSGTVDTLLSAHRTAKASIFCTICPQKFQSGSQNVMFCSVMINVMADHWHRVRKASAHDLKKGFGTSDDDETNNPIPDIDGSSATTPTMPDCEALEWRTFGYNLIRAHVFGDAPIPQPPYCNKNTNTRRPTPLPISSPMTLMSVLTSFEQRQMQWHDKAPWTGEFPRRFTSDLQMGYAPGMTMADINRCHEQARAHHGDGEHDFLCLRIVDAARRVVSSLDTEGPAAEA